MAGNLPEYVYRALRNDENPDEGLVAENPNACVSAEDFIAYGSRLSTQFIATTASYHVAYHKFGHNGCRTIVKIDVKIAIACGLRCYDFRFGDGLSSCRAINFATSSDEILFEGGRIPSFALTVVHRPSI